MELQLTELVLVDKGFEFLTESETPLGRECGIKRNIGIQFIKLNFRWRLLLGLVMRGDRILYIRNHSVQAAMKLLFGSGFGRFDFMKIILLEVLVSR